LEKKPVSDRIAFKRKTLFRKSKPLIRPVTDNDLWVFYANYDKGGFDDAPRGLDKTQFYNWLVAKLEKNTATFVVEDANRMFKDKRGLVCVLNIQSDGYKVDPTVDWFKWATKVNMLRCVVRYFGWIRFHKDVGVCVITCLIDSVNLYQHARKYGVLNYVGRIPGGSPKGDLFCFSIMGKLNFKKESD